MALKMSSFITIVICVFVAAMAVAPKSEAQFEIFNRLLGLLRIQGTVFCTANGQIGVNGTSTPIFANAVVQLQCGNGTTTTVVSSAITNSSGVFSMLLDPINLLLSVLLRDCNLVVTTPLSTCNAALPSVGGLFSGLQLIGTTILGLLNINNIVPSGFRFAQNLNG